jgi:hypothetical protein
MRRSTFTSLLAIGLVGVGLIVHASSGRAATTPMPVEPFSATSYWKTPSSASADPNSAKMLSWLSSVLPTGKKYIGVRASGLNGGSPAQGTTVYYGASTDPTYSICHNPKYRSYTFPPDSGTVHIPTGAKAPTDSDADMIVYNQFAGKVFWFTNMQMTNGKWCASQMSVYYTSSNGLIQYLSQSDNKSNWGKHGLAPITQAVRWAEVVNGSVPHAMDIYIPQISCNDQAPGGKDWFPLYEGTQCTTSTASSIPAGAVIRIKPTINLSSFNLNPDALVIANALQTYGAVVGDKSGVGNMAMIKLEDTVDEGKGNLWLNAGVNSASLSAIPLSDYQIDQLGAARP